MLYSLWQCDVFTRIGYSLVDRADPLRPPYNTDRTVDDPFHHEPRGGRRSGPVCIRTRPERRYSRAKSSCMHHRYPSRGRMRTFRRQKGRYQSNRHTSRRENVRDSAHQRGMRKSHRPR